MIFFCYTIKAAATCLEMLNRLVAFTISLLLTFIGIFMLFHMKTDQAVKFLSSAGLGELNMSALFFASPISKLCLVVLSSDGNRLPRTVQMLETAAYPDMHAVDLVIVNNIPNSSLITKNLNWSHGQFHLKTRIKPLKHTARHSTVVVVIDDRMEVSPFYAFWFLLQSNASVISGGATGFAVSGGLWNRLFEMKYHADQPTVLGLLMESTLLCNCSLVFPRLDYGRVFVRNTFQSPVKPESFPKSGRGISARGSGIYNPKIQRVIDVASTCNSPFTDG